MSRLRFTFIFLCLSFAFPACQSDDTSSQSSLHVYYYDDLPMGFDFPEIPEDNPMYVEKIELGKKLFFDPILSKDNSVSCGSCHLPQNSFSDTLNFSLGIERKIGERNSPAIHNVAYRTSFFKDGGVPTLELQILGPFDNELEFDLNIVEAVERLKSVEDYVVSFKQVFGTEPTVFGLTRAIAAYERTLISGNSKYDLYLNGLTDLTSEEKRGRDLFFSDELNCSSCHNGLFFTDQSFQNNGLLENYIDTGRARITLKSEDVGKFVVPTLRNIELSAPYMFDGSLSTLSSVIDHYASGGSTHPNKSEKITGFSITEEEKQDLILFLNTLTDSKFIETHKADNPFE